MNDDDYGDDYDDSDAGVVIKPAQSRREPEIAAIAGRLKIGPRQRATLPGFISEEFVPGVFLTELPPERATPARMRAIGKAVAAALRGLHAAGICYNDATISDPEGRAHIIVRPDGGIRLIDFGVALLLDDHPAGLTFEDAYNAARTDPSFRLLRRLANPDAAMLGQLVSDYGRRLAGRRAAAGVRLRPASGRPEGGNPGARLEHRRPGGVFPRRAVRSGGRRGTAGWACRRPAIGRYRSDLL